MWDWIGVNANSLLVVVGAAGVLVALLTILAIWRQTTVGKEAAEAALLNAQAVINAERATLLFTVTKERVSGPPGPPSRTVFKIAIKNFGRVPAQQILIAESREIFVNSPDELPTPPPNYVFPDQTPRYLVPGDAFVIAELDPEKPGNHNQRARQGINFDRQLIQTVIFGEVTYRDGISAELRHSRFCFGHNRWPFSNIGGSAVPCGPDAYRECT